jgi:hypothetical protein
MQANETETPVELAIIILNIVLIVGVLGVIVGLCTWAISTQHRDHGVLAEGSLARRRIWSPRPRPHAGPVRPRTETHPRRTVAAA